MRGKTFIVLLVCVLLWGSGSWVVRPGPRLPHRSVGTRFRASCFSSGSPGVGVLCRQGEGETKGEVVVTVFSGGPVGQEKD